MFGRASNETGTTFGVHGLSNSANGRGVFGEADHPTGFNIGVRGLSTSQGGLGVVGEVTATTGFNEGVRGRTHSTSGRGVNGWAGASTGTTYGVFGQSTSSTGRGVYGLANTSGGTNFGVLGQTGSSTGWGVYSVGNMGASGTKSFVIDHPFDPENKYLRHYSAEGPEPQNIYNGTITLDGRGEAWVELPDYFAAINRDPRYMLTPIGGAMPNLHVAEEIDLEQDHNRFRVAGGQPGLKVSWEVKAVRDDLYVRTHGAPVEVAKPESLRGTYQHPELYGQPPERGEGYIDTRESPQVDPDRW